MLNGTVKACCDHEYKARLSCLHAARELYEDFLASINAEYNDRMELFQNSKNWEKYEQTLKKIEKFLYEQLTDLSSSLEIEYHMPLLLAWIVWPHLRDNDTKKTSYISEADRVETFLRSSVV